MPKPNKDIDRFRQACKDAGIELDVETHYSSGFIKKFRELFDSVVDPRYVNMCHYRELSDILFTAYLAILCNRNTWNGIAEFARIKFEQGWLGKLCPSFVKAEKTPSHDTFNRIFSKINRDEVHIVVVKFLLSCHTQMMQKIDLEKYGEDIVGLKLYCVDGKEERGTGRKFSATHNGKRRNIQILHILDYNQGISLVSELIATKTNEIPVAQEYLELMDIPSGAYVSFDALNTQTETIHVISQRGAGYVGGLKGNQGGLLEEVTAEFTPAKMQELKRDAARYWSESEKAHGQFEKREYYVIPAEDVPHINADKKWDNLNAIVRVDKTAESLSDGTITRETRFYITSSTDIKITAYIIRAHWSVESYHWLLDTIFLQDANRTMNRNAFANLDLLQKMALKTIDLCWAINPHQVGRPTIRQNIADDPDRAIAAMETFFGSESIQTAKKGIQKKLKVLRKAKDAILPDKIHAMALA